jgi:hypothetical protein
MLRLVRQNKWPAAAVIPAPIAYIKVVAVKKLVVEFPAELPVRKGIGYLQKFLILERTFTVIKIECSKQACA